MGMEHRCLCHILNTKTLLEHFCASVHVLTHQQAVFEPPDCFESRSLVRSEGVRTKQCFDSVSSAVLEAPFPRCNRIIKLPEMFGEGGGVLVWNLSAKGSTGPFVSHQA